MNLSRRTCLATLACAPAAAIARPAIPTGRSLRGASSGRSLYTAATAPDRLSQAILARPVRRLTEGFVAGSNPAALIHARFAGTIEHNFACASPVRLARWLDTVEPQSLHALAQAYVNVTEFKARPMLALDILSHRLDARRLAHLSAYFGHARVHASVLRSAVTKVEEFNLRASPANQGPAPGVMQLYANVAGRQHEHGASYLGFLDYTIPEIYLSFRTAPIGATSIAASLFQTGLIAGTGLSIAGFFGWTIGGYLATGLQVYTPNLWISIGDTVGEWVESLTAPPLTPPESYASPEEQHGQLQMDGYMDVFNIEPAYWDAFAIYGGDFESTSEWADYVPYTEYGQPSGGCIVHDECGPGQMPRHAKPARRR